MVSRGSALEPPQAPSLSGTGSDASAPIGPTTDLADASAPSPPDGATKGWIRPAETPTQDGPNGVKFDFNSGARVLLPKGGAPWKVGISDLDTGNILFQTKIEGGRVNSAKRTYVRIRIEVERQREPPFVHDYDAAGSDMLINFPGGTLGDAIGCITSAARFQAARRRRLTCAMIPALRTLRSLGL
jgi:autotransporter strand-loop-strand O-heptosyltransferase